MKSHWASALGAAVIAATTVLNGQGSPRPTNTPPTDKASPPGVQRAPAPPSAQTKAENLVTVTGCIQAAATAIAAATTGSQPVGPAIGPAAGTTDATPAEKAAERTGNVPDPHESPAANSQASYFLNDATIAADPRSRQTVGTSGLTSASYRLEGDSAQLKLHLNRQVRIVGTIQRPTTSPTPKASRSAAAGQVITVESLTMVSEKCDATK